MNVYLYVLDTLADWEIGYLTAELNSKRYFRNKNDDCKVITVGNGKEPICTMGGLYITPDIDIKEIRFQHEDILILPGGDTWQEEENRNILLFAKDLISRGAKVAAICGATVGLATVGALDNKKHTSNDKGFLKMVCPEYSGESNYIEKPAIVDEYLITASGLGALEFTYEILRMLNVFRPETLESWYNLYTTKEAQYFYSLMSSLSE
ncbi:type 1 glutamine amidotransferase family protein [Marispirochaeta sp.]|uniref:type 1 glutamine amidotransferase family protein n=1 Tax=Marispirochaeta sp. TaxID=2038653 RepID=UPI0029C88988|nr:type 1 glutamine amidotransferase family protein [Marispirochaeta sp.]